MNQETNTQVGSSLQEMKDKFGSVSIAHQNMRRSDGTEFTAHGLLFGRGMHSCFASFSGPLAHEDQSKRDEEFKNLDAKTIGRKVWAEKDQFQALHKRDKTTGELLYHKDANGNPKLDQPILTICRYNDFNIVDEVLA